ncbi:MAG: hypothetical protein KAH95_06345 [Spirochaetales bacterium]|nr:hypothetical protein [Spirochaetales bacterium]
MTVSGDYAYIAAGTYGLQVIDISNPLTPITLAFADTPDRAHSVTVIGNCAYIADGASGLQIIDLWSGN